jgi:5-dehydro-2-deoxygluconokinase
MLVLGLNAKPEALKVAFDACATEPLCRGFAVGRSVFLESAKKWLLGQTTDPMLIEEVSEQFRWCIATWEASHSQEGL